MKQCGCCGKGMMKEKKKKIPALIAIMIILILTGLGLFSLGSHGGYREGFNDGYDDMKNNVYNTCNEPRSEFKGNWMGEEDMIIINNESGCFVLIYENGILKK